MGVKGWATVPPAALTPPIQHKTLLQFSDFSDDDQLYSVLAGEPSGHDPNPDLDDDSDVDSEVESTYEVVDDVEVTLGVPYLPQRLCAIDLTPATLAALGHLRAPSLADVEPPSLRGILDGSATPAYRACRQHGVWERFFLQATRPLERGEAVGVLVGRLVETSRWKAEARRPQAHSLALRRWDVPAKEIRALGAGVYLGPDLMVDLEAAANELVHLQDPFWEQEGNGWEEANTELACSLVGDPGTGAVVPIVVLRARRPIQRGEMLTVSWKDEFWVEVSVRENMTAAATAWACLHLPLLRLRNLARRHGVPVALAAPYYPEELQKWKRMKEREVGGVATSPASPAAAPGVDSSYLAAVVASEGGTRRRQRRFNRMFIDAEGSWFLNDGNGPRLLVGGGPRTTRPPPPPPDEAFHPLTDAELAQMPYTTRSDFRQVPDRVKEGLAEKAHRAAPVPAAELDLIASGLCPKVEIHEVVALHHPVRFLTRPDRKAYGAHVRPGAAVAPGEALGAYVGEAFLGRDFEKNGGDNVDDKMYVYTLESGAIARCFGHARPSAATAATFPKLMFDAGRGGNATRFINDVYARPGAPRPTVEAQVTVDPRSGLPHMLVRWAAKAAPGKGWDELTVEYGSTGYWKVGGRALNRQLKAHAEVAAIAVARLRAALRERGVEERTIDAAAAPVDLAKEKWYFRELDDDEEVGHW